MKTLTIVLLIQILFAFSVLSDTPLNTISSVKTFSKEEIKNLSSSYLEGKLDFDNPVMVDVDKDSDFDALKFEDGNVAYYKNVGNLDNPSFILENANYDKYENAFFIDTKMPYPMFFADNDGDGDMDMFVVKDKVFNNQLQKFEYKVASAENSADLSTGTLITIILVLVIVLLVLAIIRWVLISVWKIQKRAMLPFVLIYD